METIGLHYYMSDGRLGTKTINKSSVKCPHCKMIMIPQFIFLDSDSFGRYSIFCRCTNPKCEHTFISEYSNNNSMGGLYFKRVEPNHSLDTKDFSEIIKEVSPSFCEIYNQAYAAQQMNLMQICGVGYRKALEFLIKDYIISKDDSKAESIKSKLLGNCINEDVTDERIKQVAKRATWIGNDETHYVRKWEDKDVSNLVALIDLTIRWIESEKETEKLLESMPERK